MSEITLAEVGRVLGDWDIKLVITAAKGGFRVVASTKYGPNLVMGTNLSGAVYRALDSCVDDVRAARATSENISVADEHY